MARKPLPPGSPSQKKLPAGRAPQADANGFTTNPHDRAAKPRFDVTKVEGFIPIEQLKNGWTLPDYDPDCPEHEQLAMFFARVLVRLAAEKRARSEAGGVTAEPKFVRVGRASAAHRRAVAHAPAAGKKPPRRRPESKRET